MNNKHLVLSIALVFGSLSVCAYDGDSVDQQQGELFRKARGEVVGTITDKFQGWYNNLVPAQPAPTTEQPVVAIEDVVAQPDQTEVLPITARSVEVEPAIEDQSSDVTVDANSTLNGLRDYLPTFEINKAALIKYGVGAVIAVTVGGLTYVAYKNGSLKKFGVAVKNHPILSSLIVAHIAWIVYLHQTGQFASNFAEPAKS